MTPSPDLAILRFLAARTHATAVEVGIACRFDGDKLARLPDVLKALAKGGFTLALLDCPGIADTRVSRAIRCGCRVGGGRVAFWPPPGDSYFQPLTKAGDTKSPHPTHPTRPTA